MNTTKRLTFVAIMAALSNLLSTELFSIPIAVGPFVSKIHFAQLPIFLSGLLAGQTAGLLAGAAGGLYMSFTVLPFIIGGLAYYVYHHIRRGSKGRSAASAEAEN